MFLCDGPGRERGSVGWSDMVLFVNFENVHTRTLKITIFGKFTLSFLKKAFDNKKIQNYNSFFISFQTHKMGEIGFDLDIR